jgi:hypothetical protein
MAKDWALWRFLMKMNNVIGNSSAAEPLAGGRKLFKTFQT